MLIEIKYKILLNIKYTFNNFVIWHGKCIVVGTCEAIAKSLFDTYNSLFIYGWVGGLEKHIFYM